MKLINKNNINQSFNYISTHYLTLCEILFNIVAAAISFSFFLTLSKYPDQVKNFISNNKTNGISIVETFFYRFSLWMFVFLILVILYHGIFETTLSKTRKKSAVLLLFVLFSMWWYYLQIYPTVSFGLEFTYFIITNSMGYFILNKIRRSNIIPNLSIIEAKKITYSYFLLAIASVLFFVFFTVLAITKYNNLLTGFDLAIFDQIVYKLSRFGNSFSSIEYFYHFKSVHFSPILILVAPLYWLYPSPVVLLILQVLCITFSGVILYRLAYQHLDNVFIALSLTISYFLQIGIHGLLAYDFHEVFIFPLLIFLSLFCFERNKYAGFFICIFLMFLIKEDAAIYGAFIGLFIIFYKRNFKIGLITILLSGAYFLIVTNIFFKINAGFINMYSDYYSEGLKGLSAIIVSLVTNPLYIIKFCFTNEPKLMYWFIILAPVLFLPVLSRNAMIILIPSAFFTLLTMYPLYYSLDFHYAGSVIAFVYVLAVIGLTNINSKKYIILSILILCNSISINSLYGKFSIDSINSIEANNSPVKNIVKLVPPQASISAPNTLLPLLTHRDSVFLFPDLHNAQYVIFDRYSDIWPLPNRHEGYKVIRDLYEKNYTIKAFYPGAYLLEKNGPHDQDSLINTFYGFLLYSDCGHYEEDSMASYKQTIVARPEDYPNGPICCMSFGPFIKLNAGKYRVSYKVKVENNIKTDTLITLDVFTPPATTYAQKILTGNEFPESNKFETFKIDFELKEMQPKMEFRILYFKKTKVTLDHIKLIQIH